MFEKLFYSFPVFFWKPQLIPDMSSADFIPARVTLLVRSSSMGGMLAPLLISKVHRNFIKVLSFICFFLGTLAFYHLTHAPDFSKAAVYPFCDLYPNLDHSLDLSLEHEAYCLLQVQTHHSCMGTPGLSSLTPRHSLSPDQPQAPCPDLSIL